MPERFSAVKGLKSSFVDSKKSTKFTDTIDIQ